MENNIVRKGFGLKTEIEEKVKVDYKGNLVDRLIASNNELTFGNTTVKLAKEFGFCYGVDRAIDYTYETIHKFSDKTIYLTGEMIHNPLVNSNLFESGIRFLSGAYHQREKIEDIKKNDIVILPAFGVSISMLDQLKSRNCIIVDTTCGSVINVWKHVKRFSSEGFTAIIHGKYYHEETIATASYAVNQKYLIVKDLYETQIICDYILLPKNKTKFLDTFKNAYSQGFDPDIDLQKIGVANQTTMLAGESLQVAKKIEETLIIKYDSNSINDHFRSFDTICSATQERQEAIIELLKTSPDITLVIGGFNSSNTMNLNNIAVQYAPSFHITDASCLIDEKSIRHKPGINQEIIVTKNWLPKDDLTIAITAGASTPNNITSKVIEKVLELRK